MAAPWASTPAVTSWVVQAPLALFAFDYRRLGDMFVNKTGEDADMQRELIQALGVIAAKLVVDGRGVVASMSIEMR